MIDFHYGPTRRNCEGTSRRNFLLVGVLGLGSLSLAHMLQGKAAAATRGVSGSDKSVIWLWLGGGPTQIETFDPKMTAPSEYRSVTGEVQTALPSVTFGGNFERIGQVRIPGTRVDEHMIVERGDGSLWMLLRNTGGTYTTTAQQRNNTQTGNASTG